MNKSLKIASILEKNYAISQEDAFKILPQLEIAIQKKEKLQLSFEGLENCSTIFLRNTLGNLFLKYGKDVEKSIEITGLNPSDEILPIQIERLKSRALNSDTFRPIFDLATS
jgi:hypothetical protein